MFRKACSKVREATYGIIGISKTSANTTQATNATAFMIAPGVLATAAHLTHIANDVSKPIHQSFEAIRAPDIVQAKKMESAKFIAEDPIRDIALISINNPRSNICVSLEKGQVPIGTSCGSIGFPLSNLIFKKTGRSLNLIERFQSASISSFNIETHTSGQRISFYETDSLMYKGSSGCPGFLVSGNVFGLHSKSRIEKQKRSPNLSKQNAEIETRLAIALWLSSMDIIDFAQSSGITI